MRSLRERHARRAVAVAIVLGLYPLARLPGIDETERAALAARFRFSRRDLPQPLAVPLGTEYAVHSSLARLSAWVSSVGAAVALADLDADGLANDVCWVDTRTRSVLVAPVPGTGERYAPFVLDARPLAWDAATTAPQGALPADLDEDGLQDVLVTYWGRTPVAFLREPGAGGAPERAAFRAVELVPEAAARGERWYTNAACRADVDGDGHVDVVLGNYFPDGARVLDATAGGVEAMQDSMSNAHNGGRNRLLLWSAPRAGERIRFVPVEEAFDPVHARAWTLAIGAADLDGDLLPELYMANDFAPDRLLHNRSEPGRVRLVPLVGERTLGTPRSSVLGRDSFKGMGVDFGDLNGDGLLDLYVSNITGEYALEESQFVFVSTGATERMRDGVAPYADAGEALGLSRSGWAWDARLADFDNDGVLEAVQATGFVRGTVDRWPELQELATGNDELVRDPRAWPRFGPGDDLSGHERNAFFVRARSGRFVDLAREVGLEETWVSRGLAVADVDGDGDLDLAVANQWQPSCVYVNEAPRPGGFLGLHLVHAPDGGETRARPGHPAGDGGRPAIGATARVRLADGRALVAQVDGGSGHSGERAPELVFGLGRVGDTASLDVELAWRDPAGHVRRAALELAPGWHTVLLGGPAEGARETVPEETREVAREGAR